MTTTAAPPEQAQHLTFSLAGEEFALEILRVKEIIEFTPPTTVPMTPAAISGVINVRGSVVPVIDLAVSFGVGAGKITNRTCIIIVEVRLEGEDTVMGIVADTVNEVTYLTADDIEPPPTFGTHVSVEFLRGIGKVGDKFVLMLDIDRVLSSADLNAVAKIQEGGEAQESEGDGEAPADEG